MSTKMQTLPTVSAPVQRQLLQQPSHSPQQDSMKFDPKISVKDMGAPTEKVSPRLAEELRVKEVAQAIVILNPDAGLAASVDTFDRQATDVERHFVVDDRSWSAAIAKVMRPHGAHADAVESALSIPSRGPRGRQAAVSKSVQVHRYPSLGVVLGDVHAEGLAALQKDPGVRYVGSSMGISLVRPTRVAAAGAPQGTTWGISALEADRLWANGITGAGVRVGHIDTGVDGTHPALKDAIESFLLTNDEGFPVAKARPVDTGVHGTHTAATIAGRATGGRSVGVAPGVELYCAAVIEGGNTIARILAGLDWAVRSGVRIVSMSLGIRGYHDDFYEIMRALRSRGVLPVVAVGNEGPGTSRSPGNYDLVVSVGACDSAQRVPWFSSSDTFVQPVSRQVPDVVGPGVDVISAKAGGGYTAMDGSSMATPHVAGLAALLLQAKGTSTVEQIEHAIYQSCQPSPDGRERGGRGLPNAPRALAILTGQQLPNVATRMRAKAGIARRGRSSLKAKKAKARRVAVARGAAGKGRPKKGARPQKKR